MNPKSLQFANLDARHAGVTAGVAASYSEATRVCLARHHSPPKIFSLKDNQAQHEAAIAWVTPDERTKGAWANKDDTTEAGAYCLALAAIEVTRELVAVSRAETRTGADYYLGAPNAETQDLEKSVRLEVSGTDEGNDAAIARRLHQKIEQASKGKSNLPAIAAVVGFSALQIVSADVEQT